MKDEIKVRNLTQQAIDVLNDLKNLKSGEEYEAGMPVDIMASALLDYITNLQEENKKLLEDKDSWHRVAQKNYNEMQDKIDKAIEYTKTIDDWDIKDFRRNNILKILKGE